MKKRYKVKDISVQDYNSAAAENTGGSTAVEVPLIDLTGDNLKVVSGGQFKLPMAKECEKETLEVAYRILGVPVTKDLLLHLPPNEFTTEDIGILVPYYPFAYHRRFGDTYSDRVCPASTRSGKCPICRGRIDLFSSPEYKSGAIVKDQIIKNGGFGTKLVALFIAQVYFDDEDQGTCAVLVNVTNEKATMAKKENFFDRVSVLRSPKKLMASETLPPDYFGDGDGARWLIAEYTKAIYHKDGDGGAGSKKGRNKGYPYWKLQGMSCTAEIPGAGKACDIWWPKSGKKYGEDVFDLYKAINHTDPEELVEITKDAVTKLLTPRAPIGSAKTTTYKSNGDTENVEVPTWSELVSMEIDDLVKLGISLGGDEESLTLIGDSNIALLRRNMAKMCGVKITKVVNKEETTKEEEVSSARTDIDTDEIGDDDNLPF